MKLLLKMASALLVVGLSFAAQAGSGCADCVAPVTVSVTVETNTLANGSVFIGQITQANGFYTVLVQVPGSAVQFLGSYSNPTTANQMLGKSAVTAALINGGLKTSNISHPSSPVLHSQ